MRRKLGRYEEAAATYREFLTTAEKQRTGKQQKELIAEARIQLAACEKRLVPSLAASPAAAVAQAPPAGEGTEPPRPGHPPVLSALRGRPLQPPAGNTGGPQPFESGRTIPAWSVTALIGGERSTEQSYTDSALIGRIGIEGSRRFAESWIAVASGDWRVPPAIRPLRELAGRSGDAGRES